MDLINNLIQESWLKTSRIINAFKKIKRIDFLPTLLANKPERMGNLAELNEALPIGYGQTISQPLVVAFMLELLQPKLGDRILDIGSGSGWTSALLAHCVSQVQNSKVKGQNHNLKLKTGKIIAIEVIPELKVFGEQNVAKYNYIKKGIVKCLCADGSKGYQKEAPFDKILASAAIYSNSNSNELEKIPQEWKEQLEIGGRIVVPINSSIWLFIKKTEQSFEETEYPGFAFVPLLNEQ